MPLFPALHLFICHSLIHSSIQSFTYSSTYPSTHPLIHSPIHPLIQLSTNSSIHQLICSLTHSLLGRFHTRPLWQKVTAYNPAGKRENTDQYILARESRYRAQTPTLECSRRQMSRERLQVLGRELNMVQVKHGASQQPLSFSGHNDGHLPFSV